MKKLFITLFVLAACLNVSAFKSDTLAIATDFLSSPEKVTVITPDRTSADKRFPTVYLLNGYGGDHKAWGIVQPKLGQLADAYGMVIVMPDGRDSWYWDSPIDPEMQMESFITKKLVPFIDSNYPTIPQASKRAISGLSMGGHGALWLATRHPDLFGSAGSMSGGVDIRPFAKKWKMESRLGSFEKNPDVVNKHTVATMVPQIKEAGINIIIDCGADDFFAQVNDQLHADLLAAGVAHDYTSRPGGHSRTYWRNSILYHLLFFNEAFNK